jgi:hypothetical protein
VISTTSVAQGRGRGKPCGFPSIDSFADAAISAARGQRRHLKKGALEGNMVSLKGASEAGDATEVAVDPQLAK